jgi:hypothetical protein
MLFNRSGIGPFPLLIIGDVSRALSRCHRVLLARVMGPDQHYTVRPEGPMSASDQRRDSNCMV